MRAEFRYLPALLALTLALAGLAGGCGGSSRQAIRIGVISDCEGPFASGYEGAIAAAELPLIERGARLRGRNPSGGVRGASVAGKPVELLVGCERWGDRWKLLAELRRLVEREGANVVIGPTFTGDGIAVREYARQQPGVTFLLASGEQSATLKRQAPNVFRFSLDAAQSAAGVGSYAYRRLGWRRVVTVGEDDPSGWPVVAGFVAEFCSLGGTVVQRFWANADSVALGRIARRISTRRADGVYFAGNGVQSSRSFVAALSRRRPDLSRSLVGGASVLFENLDARMLGVVAVSASPLTASPSWHRFTSELVKTFPHAGALPFLVFSEHDAMEAALEALEQVGGDLSHGEHRLMAALARLKLKASVGPIRLDTRRQAVGPAFLGTVARDASGRFVVRQLRVVPNVEQTFGGYFSPTTPAPSRTQPVCRRGHPPSWARTSAAVTR
jgi:branched-chain amino acid transport system substrate-binding protein